MTEKSHAARVEDAARRLIGPTMMGWQRTECAGCNLVATVKQVDGCAVYEQRHRTDCPWLELQLLLQAGGDS